MEYEAKKPEAERQGKFKSEFKNVHRRDAEDAEENRRKTKTRKKGRTRV
jgi:hypothetical protein